MIVAAIITPTEFNKSPKMCRYAASTFKFLFFSIDLLESYFSISFVSLLLSKRSFSSSE